MGGHVAVGGSSTRSKGLAAYSDGVGGVAAHQQGARLTTTDGRVLLDWVGSLGATPLGVDNRIRGAIMAQLVRGPLFSFPSVAEEETAAALCEALGWPEQVKFTKTGSEACAAACRIARAATGRTRVSVFRGHYHGWHDWHAVTTDDHPGVPDTMAELVDVLPVVDWESHVWWQDCAAIMLEPATRSWVPSVEWLESLMAKTREAGALVIFDEMIMGGRLALGGVSEYYGLRPDLATYGKAFGAGLPLAFVAGPEALMQHSQYVSGTYSGETLSLAACRTMLDIYEAESVCGRLHEYGEHMQAAVKRPGVTVTGFPVFWSFRFERNHEARMAACVQRCAQRGVLIHPTYLAPCAAMTAAEVADSCQIVDAVLTELMPEWKPTTSNPATGVPI